MREKTNPSWERMDTESPGWQARREPNRKMLVYVYTSRFAFDNARSRSVPSYFINDLSIWALNRHCAELHKVFHMAQIHPHQELRNNVRLNTISVLLLIIFIHNCFLYYRLGYSFKADNYIDGSLRNSTTSWKLPTIPGWIRITSKSFVHSRLM